MIRLESASKTYSSKEGPVYALDSVTLDIPAGQFVAVRGHSGCGKSTLLSLVGGLACPTAGKVIVDRSDIGSMSPAERAAFRAQHVGFVFQMFHLLPYLNVLDNVLVAATAANRAEAAQTASELLNSFGLNDRISHRPSELSTGERQRVAMARALVNRPKLLLADEPTGNLDPENADILMQLVTDFHGQGGTVLLVTHEQQAADYAERTITLRDGRLEDAQAVATKS